MKSTLLQPFLLWVYTAIGVTALCGIIYISVQQQYRTGLDDPQIQIAEDGALSLSKGGVPADVVPNTASLSDMSASLAPWVAVYDSSGKPLESSALLNDAPPQLPQGVFNSATWSKATMYLQNNMRETRFSWQPNGQVRQAVVLVHAGNGMYVASGRNMREVEQRIEHLGEIIFAGWIVTLAILLAAVYLYRWLLRTI